MKKHLLWTFIMTSILMTTAQGTERLVCRERHQDHSSSSLSLIPHEVYGVLGELSFDGLSAQMICSQVTPNSMECLGHWKRDGQVQERLELYVIESGQVDKARAYFGLPSEYGKKQVWFECTAQVGSN